MPVKKTTTKTAAKKTTATKKAIVKKTITKKFATKNSAAKKPAAIVETKKTNNTNACTLKHNNLMRLLFVVLLLWNLVFGLLVFMKQDSALKLEEMKVWWHENFEKVMELYNSDFYKQQQTAAIQQFMWQANAPQQVQPEPQAAPTQEVETVE